MVTSFLLHGLGHKRLMISGGSPNSISLKNEPVKEWEWSTQRVSNSEGVFVHICFVRLRHGHSEILSMGT